MDGQALLWFNIAGCVAGGLVGLAFAGVAWQNRDVPAALPYGTLALAVSAWGFLYAALLLASDVTIATWLSQLTRAVTVFVPILWFRFTSVYTGNDQLRTRPVMALLWAITVVYVALNLTVPFHDFLAYRVVFETVDGLTAPVDPQGPVFWAFIVYAYTVITVGFGLLLRFLLRSRNIYRKQTAAIVAGSTLPLIGNIVVLFGLVPHPALDVTPMLFAANGLVIGWALFQYDFLEVTPVATDRLVDELPDPVLVVDDSETVVEYNAAADRALGTDSIGGMPLQQLPLPAAAELPQTQHVTLESDGGERVYTPQVSSIEDQHGQQRGQLIVLRDVTVERRRFDRIQALQSTTQRFLAATSQAEIADVAVEFFEADLGLPVMWYRATDRGLVPTIQGGAVAAPKDLPSFEQDGSLWTQFETGETAVVDPATVGLEDVVTDDSTDRVLVVPVDETGVFCLGLDATADPEEYRQMATILRGTMTAALARVERETQLRESRREIDQRTEQIEFFSGVLRHNIRNGMQVIQSQTELLNGQVDDTDRLAAIETWAQELIDLTREVRRITDAVTAPEEQRRRPVDLGAVLLDRLDALDSDFDVELSRPAPIAATVYANDLVGNVIDSVLHNAVEHTDSDHPSIDVSVRETDGHVEVRIADQGPGISDELRESVFEREVATRQTGHGFGLYFVSVMMDLYEGDVWFEDNDPRGTVAVLQFRRADET